jgi:topoisomerase IA-like protein
VAAAGAGSAEDRAVIHLHKSPDRSIAFSDAPRRTRAGRGKLLIDVREGDRVVGLTIPQPRPAIGEKVAPPPEKTERSKPAKVSQARKARRDTPPAKPARKAKPETGRAPKGKPTPAKRVARKPAPKAKR